MPRNNSRVSQHEAAVAGHCDLQCPPPCEASVPAPGILMGSPDSLPAPPPGLKLDQETDKTPTNEAGRMVDLLEKVRTDTMPLYILTYCFIECF